MRSKIIFKNAVKTRVHEKAASPIGGGTVPVIFRRHFYEKIKKLYIQKGE